MSHHGYPIFVASNHNSFTQKVNKVVQNLLVHSINDLPASINDVSVSSIDNKVNDEKVATMTEDIKILLEEHNKIVQGQRDEIESLTQRINDLELAISNINDNVSMNDTGILNEKKIADLIDVVQTEIKNISRPSSAHSSRSSSPVPPPKPKVKSTNKVPLKK